MSLMEVSSVFCIILGFLLTFLRRITTRQLINVRLQFDTWLSLLSDFQSAADILATTIAPNLNDIYKLAIVSVIRTFLNFFLQREIKEEMEIRRRQMEMSHA
jgi:uncharacterized membrane protein